MSAGEQIKSTVISAGTVIAALSVTLALANWAGWNPLQTNREFRANVLARLTGIESKLTEIENRLEKHGRLHSSLKIDEKRLDELIERALRGED